MLYVPRKVFFEAAVTTESLFTVGQAACEQAHFYPPAGAGTGLDCAERQTGIRLVLQRRSVRRYGVVVFYVRASKLASEKVWITFGLRLAAALERLKPTGRTFGPVSERLRNSFCCNYIISHSQVYREFGGRQ
jgi:hypothetical protein